MIECIFYRAAHREHEVFLRVFRDLRGSNVLTNPDQFRFDC